MIKAVWKKNNNERFSKLDAQSCYDELMVIANNNNNEISNQKVVDYARDNPDSELHKAFNWNDAEAADAYRRETARTLKNSLYTFELDSPQVSLKDNKEIPLFLNPGSDDARNHMPTEIVMSKPDLHQATLKKALGELNSFKYRYSFLTELSGVFKAIDEINIP